MASETNSQKYLNNFVIADSPIEGKGVFAARKIKKGEIICFMEGELKPISEIEKMHAKGNTKISCNQLQIGLRTYMVLDNPYVLINHSCDPNAAIAGSRQMTAIRDIQEGEEILYDYSATEWTVQDYPPYYTDGWPMDCRCGFLNCRKKIGCFYYLPQAT